MTTREPPSLHSLNEQLWFSDQSCARWKINPNKMQIPHSFLNIDVEVRYIDDTSIPALYNSKGLFATNNIHSQTHIIPILDGKYYTYNEWWEFGKKREENNVIGFNCKEHKYVFEPLKYSEWKYINDCKGHKLNIAPNCTFEIDDNNYWNVPLISVVTLHKIKKNDQLLTQYGTSYWNAIANQESEETIKL